MAISLLGMLFAGPVLSTATPGAELYRQQCAKCHGKSGEGVKKEYKEPLIGDWSVDKLARYIHKSMPDDKPKSLTPDQSDAIARFIYDAFYSQEARLKKNPPRMELVRLTNRQYLNTVADLLKRFTGDGRISWKEHGLSASYRTGAHIGGNKKVFERVDRQIDYDFGAGSPDDDRFDKEKFIINWRGSLLADETGEYEFIVKTPNGARLWLNTEDDKALIDAYVATGTITEHRAKIRLIGGRAYPLQMEFFKFKDKSASVSLQWKPPYGAQMVIPARNLSPERVPATFVIATPFPADDSSVGYERGVSVSKAWDEAATQAAIEVANFVVSRLDDFSGSKRSSADRVVKLQSFCEKLVETAFRRPLTEEQKKIHVAAHFTGKNAPAPEDAVKRVVLLALKSPHFLYLGLGNAKPDDYEVAARLAFGTWDSLPDRELRKAAEQGMLRSREQVVAQAQRMMSDPRTAAKMRAFFHHWLQVNRAEDLSKDAQLFPGFTSEIIADLRTSLNLFLDDVFWDEKSDYRRLLLDNGIFVNGRLAKFYSLESEAKDDFVKAAFNPKERAGVVTHPYLLAAFSYPKMSSPIHRGVFLSRNIVGRTLKPPPEAVAFKDEEFPANFTMREKISALTRSEACQNCHAVINPLGFSLEQYDAVGRFRASDHGKPVDASGDYVTDDGEKVHFTGARDIAEYAAASAQAQSGFVGQLFNQVAKQSALAYGFDTISRLQKSFAASGFNMRQLLVEIATTTALHGVGKTAQVSKK